MIDHLYRQRRARQPIASAIIARQGR